VILPTLAPEASSARVEAFLGSAAPDLQVCDFVAAEVASAVSRLFRTNVFTRADADNAMASFDAWRLADTAIVEVDPSDVRLAVVFVRRFDLMLRAPEALHVAVCQRLGSTLVTRDRRLATAAQDLGVSVSVP
jgi:predicted nucleic acid-binding protein